MYSSLQANISSTIKDYTCTFEGSLGLRVELVEPSNRRAKYSDKNPSRDMKS